MITTALTVVAAGYYLFLVTETPKIRSVPRLKREDVEPVASEVPSPMIPSKKIVPELSPYRSPKPSLNSSVKSPGPVTPRAPHTPYTPTSTGPASRHYDISPMLRASRDSVAPGRSESSGPVTRDALQALRLASLPAPYIANLQLLLGNHLARLTQRFDLALRECDRLLTLATTVPVNQGGITGNDLAKAQAVLALRTTQDTLDNGNTITLPDIYRYLHRLGVTGSVLVDHAGMTRLTPSPALVQHLRDWARHCDDQRLRIRHQSPHSSGDMLLPSDSELVVRLFLHLCDLTAQPLSVHQLLLTGDTTGNTGNGKSVPDTGKMLFSARHCAYSRSDLDAILRIAPVSTNGNTSRSREQQAAARSGVLTVLFAQPRPEARSVPRTTNTLFPALYKLSPGLSLSPTPGSGQQQRHFDVHTFATPSSASATTSEVRYEVEAAASVFESILIFLLLTFLLTTASDSDTNSSTSTRDEEVVREVLQQVMSSEDLAMLQQHIRI